MATWPAWPPRSRSTRCTQPQLSPSLGQALAATLKAMHMTSRSCSDSFQGSLVDSYMAGHPAWPPGSRFTRCTQPWLSHSLFPCGWLSVSMDRCARSSWPCSHSTARSGDATDLQQLRGQPGRRCLAGNCVASCWAASCLPAQRALWTSTCQHTNESQVGCAAPPPSLLPSPKPCPHACCRRRRGRRRSPSPGQFRTDCGLACPP